MSEVEQWLEQWLICQECAEVKKTQVSKRLEKKRGEEKSRTEKKEEEQWNTWDQSRRDTYEQERNIGQATTYHKPKPTKTATTFGGEGVMSCDETTPEGFVRMPYGRRTLMPMPLPGSAGVPVFDGRDATVFLE